MDTAADHIEEEKLLREDDASPKVTLVHNTGEETQPQSATPARPSDLGNDVKEVAQTIYSTPWAARLEGIFGQGESYYEGATQQISQASAEASKSWSGLVSKTQGFSVKPFQDTPSETTASDTVNDTESILSRFRADAAARLKRIQQAEDAADEALERFGTNVVNFLRESVTVAPPAHGQVKRDVLFESKDAEGKRVVHATRFDAQLHVIHCRLESFTQDPQSEEYASWKSSFDIAERTNTIAQDLEKYDELRRAMGKLVPEKVTYADFWSRYYFLQHIIKIEEQKRRELLKGQAEEEEVGWDDDEEDEAGTPSAAEDRKSERGGSRTPTRQDMGEKGLLKPVEPRRSNEHSVADSDASYDIVSGAPSQGPGTPREDKDTPEKKRATLAAEQSDEEDWE